MTDSECALPPRLMVSAPASGSGKTVFTCALIRVLQRRSLSVAAFKCGPDYIDQLFHARTSLAAAGNLDGFYSSRAQLRALLARGAAQRDVAVVEGAMGFYDGMAPGSDAASAYRVALATETPVVLVVPARGASLTLAATIRGICRFREDAGVAAVVLSRVGEGAYRYARDAIERECGVPVVGYVPQDDAFSLESRHLGLVGADEVEDLQRRLDAMADIVQATVDVDALLDIARAASRPRVAPFATERMLAAPLRMAVAFDEAFCFYYEENLRVLRDLGVELVEFSPLRDRALPAGACGLMLGGGYPELHAARLSANVSMRDAVASAVGSGMPVVAECGGYLYLNDWIADEEGERWPMAGALPGGSSRQPPCGRFGYIELECPAGGLYGEGGAALRGHEFHRWQADAEAGDCRASKPGRDRSWVCMSYGATLAAGFPHVYYPSNIDAARSLVRAMQRFEENGGEA